MKQGIFVVFLGTRGQIPAATVRHRYHSGILINDSILFDLGEQKFLSYNPKAIFITHLHPDHASFVTGNYPLPSIPIYAPKRHEFDFIRVSETVRIKNLTIIPLPVLHSIIVRSVGYLVESPGSRIFYTGDLFWMEKKYREQLGKVDCIITDGSFLRKGGMIHAAKGKQWGHAGIPNLISMFRKHTGRFIITHLGSWFFEDVAGAHRAIRELSEKYSVQISLAYDGMTIQF